MVRLTTNAFSYIILHQARSLDLLILLHRLLAPDLPSPRHIRRLVEHYFANIHPIRCFAFVHKPSFMRQLDNGFSSDDEAALLHIICAHGAKYGSPFPLNEESKRNQRACELIETFPGFTASVWVRLISYRTPCLSGQLGLSGRKRPSRCCSTIMAR